MTATENDPVSTIVNMPDAEFESALKAASTAQYDKICPEMSTVPERLAFELKKKASDEQTADENYSGSSNYSDVRFDAKKLKKSTSHESYKPFMSRKSPSSFTSVHVDAAVNFPLVQKKTESESNYNTKNEKSFFTENNAPFFITSPLPRSFVIDETVPANEEELKLCSVGKQTDEKNLFSSSNYGSVNNEVSSKKRFSDVEQNFDNFEMVEMGKKADIGRNFCPETAENNDDSADHASGKRRSTSQRNGRSQEYNLAPSPFTQYGGAQSGLLLSEFNPGCITQRTRKEFDLTSSYGRFSPPPTSAPQNRKGLKQNKRNKRTDDEENVMKAEQINGFRGCDSLDSLLVFIEGPEASAKKFDDPLFGKKGGKQRKEIKKEKAKKASSIGANEEDEDDLTQGCFENSKVLCKSDDIPTKFDEFYDFSPADKVLDDEKRATLESDVETATRLAFQDRDIVVDEQFIPVTSKKQKKHRQNENSSTKRSSTPPPRQKIYDKTIGGRRKRRNSYDSSPVNVENSTLRRERLENNSRRDDFSQPSTSAGAEKSAEEASTKLSYATVVVQRRPHSPTAMSETATDLSSSRPRSTRQTASLNASRSNSPSVRSASASATNQANASNPDLKLSAADLQASSFLAVVTVSPVARRTTYATVVTSKASPNAKTAVPSDDSGSRDETASCLTKENVLKTLSESKVCLSLAADTCSALVLESLLEEKPSTVTTSLRRYSCPPMRISNHVEFLDKPGRSADPPTAALEGLSFGFINEDLTSKQNVVVENENDNCDNNNKNINNNFAVEEFLKQFSQISSKSPVRDAASQIVLKDVVNFVNKRWNEFIMTPDVIRYEN